MTHRHLGVLFMLHSVLVVFVFFFSCVVHSCTTPGAYQSAERGREQQVQRRRECLVRINYTWGIVCIPVCQEPHTQTHARAHTRG
uniref:Putative secreted protein n=1 Tax=Anopheles darlingi TaxID=43151 RepID=A0A2M4DGG7_ANODA